MYKQDLEKAEESEIKLTTSLGSYKKAGNSRKTFTSASLTMLKPLSVCITTNWKILTKMGISDHLTCLLKNLYTDQETAVRMKHGKWTGSKLRKDNIKPIYCYPAYLTYM